ncbi:hypothetical protein R80B4_02988 [Fibrobacteres bacterium R8-0-B4]
MNVNKANKPNQNTITVQRQERLCSMKKLFHVTLALMLCVSAGFAQEDIGTRVDGLQAQVNRVLSKAGIHFGGEFRSQFLNSQLSGNAIDSARKRSESAEYTSVDFDVVARPNAALGARAVFRLHQDWRNFFSDVQNPITTRWLSIDGKAAGMLEYHAGDYLKKLSPLTLWNQEFEVFYEPEIFAEARKLAMSEAFVGDSKRLLQGVDVSLRAELYPILSEIDVDLFGARLATRGTNESAVVPPGTFGMGNYMDADFDKYLIGANLGTQIINGFGISLSDIYIYDYLESYMGNDTVAKADDPQSTNVFAGRLNFDTRAVGVDDEAVLAGINAEVAYSSDNHWKVEGAGITDTSITGMAVNAGLSLRFAFGDENNIKLTADYVMNDETFKNDAAQTPNFSQRQIMNSENALNGLGDLNPFDAMYRSVFKYVPSQYFGETKPYTKNAYGNVILRDAAAYTPSVFQAAGNKATADRTGPMVNLDGSFLDEALTVGARLTAFKSIAEGKFEQPYVRYEGEDGEIIVDDTVRAVIPIKEYLTAGGGASVDIAKFWPAIGPSLKIGGSFMMYNSSVGDVSNIEKDEKGVRTAVVSKLESESQLISAELVYNFAPRFSFLFGYQSLNTTIKSDSEADDQEYKFDNIGFGFGYKVADGGALTVKLTMLSGEGPVVKGGKAETLKYTAMQPEVYLTVKF